MRGIRRFSAAVSTPTPGPKKSSSSMFYIVPGLAVLGASLYSYSTFTTKVVPKAYVPAMDQNWKDFTLKKVTKLNHNVIQCTFELPEGTSELGLPVASCLVTKFTPVGSEKSVVRPYTPMVPVKEGSKTFDLVVKVYKDGVMSKHISELKEGDKLAMKGPTLKFPYKANEFESIGLIAGGSGLTPMLQLIQDIALNPKDKTKVNLLFANDSQDDIFLKKELDNFAAKKPDQLKIHYVLAKPPTGYQGPTGYVNEKMIKQYLPAPKSKGKIFVCGPPPMINAIAGPKAKDYTQGPLAGELGKMGYESDEVFKF